jgi:CheY-like chemotaxis protein
MNILIVDDIATNRKLLRVTLEAEGHTILEAADGVEALQVLGRETVAAVISDILMPNMDGFRLCHEIRKIEKLHALPFIVYTSTYTSSEDVKLSHSIGADKYLTKPAPTATMLQTLHEAVHNARSRVAIPATEPEEIYVLKQYSETLVNKLEQKNAELLEAMASLQRAHDRIVELNTDLERRVKERTAELEATNQDLTRTLSEVKELRGIVPICCYCKNIRDDTNFWESVEAYVSRHSDAQFSHGICPDCYAAHVKPELDALKLKRGLVLK